MRASFHQPLETAVPKAQGHAKKKWMKAGILGLRGKRKDSVLIDLKHLGSHKMEKYNCQSYGSWHEWMNFK